MCWLLVFFSATTQDVLVGDNGGEGADGWRRSDVAGQASDGPGRTASFIDSNSFPLVGKPILSAF